MSFGGICPVAASLVGAEGSDRASESVSEFISSIVFLLGSQISGVGYAEGGLLRDSQELSSLSLESSG